MDLYEVAGHDNKLCVALWIGGNMSESEWICVDMYEIE